MRKILTQFHQATLESIFLYCSFLALQMNFMCCPASLLCFLTEIVQLERSFQKLKSLWKWNKHPFSSSASALWASTCSDPWQSSTKEGPRCCLDWPEPWSAYGGWKSHHSLCCLPSVSRGTQDARYDKEGNTEVWWLGWRRWSAVPRGQWSCWTRRCDRLQWGNKPGWPQRAEGIQKWDCLCCRAPSRSTLFDWSPQNTCSLCLIMGILAWRPT